MTEEEEKLLLALPREELLTLKLQSDKVITDIRGELFEARVQRRNTGIPINASWLRDAHSKLAYQQRLNQVMLNRIGELTRELRKNTPSSFQAHFFQVAKEWLEDDVFESLVREAGRRKDKENESG